MRKVILYIATSIDNFIARVDGSVDWLDKTPNPGKNDYGYNALMERVDTTLMGNATYKEILGFGVPWPYTGMKNYVFSREDQPDNQEVSFVSGDMVDFVQGLIQESGKDIWLIGGGQVNTVLLNAGLIDEIIITKIPVVLGEGIPLFGNKPAETWFSLDEVQDYKNGIVQLRYKK